MPFYVATREFFALVRARLAPRGVVMMNVLGSFTPGRDELVRAVGRTMASVFPSVYAMAFSGNTVLLATAHETDLAALRGRLEAVPVEALRHVRGVDAGHAAGARAGRPGRRSPTTTRRSSR